MKVIVPPLPPEEKARHLVAKHDDDVYAAINEARQARRAYAWRSRSKGAAYADAVIAALEAEQRRRTQEEWKRRERQARRLDRICGLLRRLCDGEPIDCDDWVKLRRAAGRGKQADAAEVARDLALDHLRAALDSCAACQGLPAGCINRCDSCKSVEAAIAEVETIGV